jgi:Histidine kinase
MEQSPPGLHAGMYSAVGAPIMVGGVLWGAATALCPEDRPLPEGSEARMAQFTDLVGTAIANAQDRAELVASRIRIVAAADEARRRLERDLHDGSQQRLVSLTLQARMAHESVPAELESLKSDLTQIVSGLKDVSSELREISRGIPRILSEGGLALALETLARRCLFPVNVSLAIEQQLPEPVAVTTYYVAAEALTNSAKHAHASEATLCAETKDGVLYLSIDDNGIGGADLSKGSGLVGLNDRVEAFGGHMVVNSPPGAGRTAGRAAVDASPLGSPGCLPDRLGYFPRGARGQFGGHIDLHSRGAGPPGPMMSKVKAVRCAVAPDFGEQHAANAAESNRKSERLRRAHDNTPPVVRRRNTAQFE